MLPKRHVTSKYTYLQEALLPGLHLVYNSRSGALLEFDEEEWVYVKELLDGAPPPEDMRSELLQRLVQNLILVPFDEDEIDMVRRERHLRRSRADTMSLTIAPTMQCNFRCVYCFEEHRAEFMDGDTVAALKAFIDREAARREVLHDVHVVWFGGEPLMSPRVIEEVQSFINDLCERRGATATKSIITNGYLLDDAMVDRLLALGEWSLVQITVDGTPMVHDGRRPLVSGKGTFERVTRNTLNAVRRGLPVATRVNVDSSNSSPALMRALLLDFCQRGLGDVVPTMYLGSVVDSTPECSHMGSSTLSLAQAAKTRLNFSRELLRLGFSAKQPLPKPTCVLCTADSPNGFVISPRGLVFKCWNEIHMPPSKAIMSLSPDLCRLHPEEAETNRRMWDDYNPHDKEECVNCKAMPACMGGCPWESMMTTPDHHGHCGTLKFFPKEVIQMFHADRAISECAFQEEEPSNGRRRGS